MFSRVKACWHHGLNFRAVCRCTTCLVPGLAALWGAWVGRGVVVAGGLHTRGFTLELFPRRRQRLVYCTQHVSRLGLEEGEMTKSLNFIQQNPEMRCKSQNIVISEVWLNLPFLVWRMTSSLVGDNFLCCWNSERERNLVCVEKTITKKTTWNTSWGLWEGLFLPNNFH